MTSTYLSVFFALCAAASWGSGDFSSGLAARRSGPFHTVLISYTIGMLALIVAALVRHDALPLPVDLMWGALAGLSGGAGLLFLMRGFATGRMGIVAPVSAVLAAAIPVVFTALTEGLPREVQLLGFALAVTSIWLLSRPEKVAKSPGGLDMALLAGAGFGLFFTLLSQISGNSIFWPLVGGRVTAVSLMAIFALATRRPLVPPRLPIGLLALAGVLDVAGNIFFLLATQIGRLDVSAVLVSLYPAVTALLAWLVIKEHLARLQMVGVAVAVLAIVLITV